MIVGHGNVALDVARILLAALKLLQVRVFSKTNNTFLYSGNGAKRRYRFSLSFVRDAVVKKKVAAHHERFLLF